MGKVSNAIVSADEDRDDWRVIDALLHDAPIARAELDAIEAFLMPLVMALLSDSEPSQCQSPSLALRPAAIHKEDAGVPLKNG